MALKKKTISKAKVPQKAEDVLHINDVLKQKVAPAALAGHQLTYLPIKEVVASSSVSTHGALAVLDSSPETYWQPSDQVAGAHLELITPSPYTCYGVDIKFKESEGKKFNLKVDVLDRQNNRWLTMAVSESSLIDDNKYERFQAAQHFKTDTLRIIINSVFDTATGNIYTQPKITQVRFFGLVPDADVVKYKVVKDQECPEGYGKDAESGQCVKTIPSQIITPKTVDAHSATDMGDKEPAGNDPENLLTVDPNDKLTLKGNGSYVEYGLDRKDVVHAVYIHKLNNPPREYTVLAAFYNGEEKQPFYHFIVDIPASQDKYIHLLNTPVRADRFVLSVTENNEPSQWFSLFGLYLIGEQGVPEEKEEPPIPKSCSIKNWDTPSAFKDKPETWKAVEMTDADKKGKWKGVGPDDKNVFHMCDSKADAEAFIKRKIWESKNGGGGKPPVVEPEKPEPPVVTPNAKVDAQGVVMIYAPKQGGQIVTAKETNEKQSKHNTGTRSSLYSNKPYSANSGELTEYFVMNLSDNNEQNAPKLLSGGHTGSGESDTTRQGICYAAGINQNGSLHLAKEWPYHPKTPKAYQQIVYVDNSWKSLGSIKDKVVGMKIIYFPVEKSGKKGTRIEWWFDKKGFETQKLENDWQQMAFAEDFGDWGNKFGPPILENSGVKYKGKILGFYIRIDTPTKPVKFSNQGQHELEIPVKRLIGVAPAGVMSSAESKTAVHKNTPIADDKVEYQNCKDDDDKTTTAPPATKPAQAKPAAPAKK